jgi:hypothetical protein
VAEVVLEMVALIFEGIESLIFVRIQGAGPHSQTFDLKQFFALLYPPEIIT